MVKNYDVTQYKLTLTTTNPEGNITIEEVSLKNLINHVGCKKNSLWMDELRLLAYKVIESKDKNVLSDLYTLGWTHKDHKEEQTKKLDLNGEFFEGYDEYGDDRYRIDEENEYDKVVIPSITDENLRSFVNDVYRIYRKITLDDLMTVLTSHQKQVVKDKQERIKEQREKTKQEHLEYEKRTKQARIEQAKQLLRENEESL